MQIFPIPNIIVSPPSVVHTTIITRPIPLNDLDTILLGIVQRKKG